MRTIITIFVVNILLFITACIPTSTPTPTPIPTTIFTPIPELELSTFDVYMKGIREHGNMTCINYQGNLSDLEDTEITCNFYQEKRKIEYYVPLEIIDDQLCFENIDSKYKENTLVKVQVEVKSSGQTVIQEYDIGPYNQVPFIQPIFRKKDLEGNVYSADPYHVFDDGSYWFATDFCLVPDCRNAYADAPGEGLPVYLPGEVEVILARIQDDNDPSDGKEFTNYMVNVYLPDTGYILSLQHVQPGPLLEDLLNGQKRKEVGYPTNGNGSILYDDSIPFLYVGPKDDFSGLAHLHIEGSIPDKSIDTYYGMTKDQNKRYFFCPDGLGPCLPDGVNFNLEPFLLEGWVSQ